MSTVATRPAAALEARRADVFARATDEVLFGAVLALEAKHDGGTPLDDAENLTRGWMLGELERRHPETGALMDRWAESDAPTFTYTQALIAAVAATQLDAEARASAQVATLERRDLTAEMSQRRAAMIEAVRARRALGERYPGRVHIQGIGMCPAIPAGDLRPGDVRLYNGGVTGAVLEILPKGRASLVLVTEEGGRRYETTVRRSTMIALSARPGGVA